MSATYKSNLNFILKGMNNQAEKAVVQAGNHLRNKWLDKLTGSRTVRTIRVIGTQVTYRSSAPGEAPASRTGRLRQSVAFVVNNKGDKVEYVLGSPLEYALWLEFGTSKMAPRPSLVPVFSENTKEVQKIVNQMFSGLNVSFQGVTGG